MTQYSLAQLTVLDASPPELIRLAREAGYDFVGLRLLEVTGGDAWPLATDAQLMREAKAAMSAYEIGVLDVELVRLTPEIRIEELRPTLEAAAELGVKHILTQAHDSDWARLVHNFGTLCDLLAGYGMTADVEFLTWTQMRGVNEVMRLLNAANRTNVGITVDT
ncbi:MAG: sugar phosphate isomerase/epimerase family protein, partial [Sphingomicrobium sp.]